VPIVYFAGSAFVKLLVEETDSDIAAALWDGCDAAVSSRLAYPEVHAALAAAGRARRLGADAQLQAQVMWEEYWAATRAVELTENIARHAGRLATVHTLRGADAVHLARSLPSGSTTPCSPCGTSGYALLRTRSPSGWRRAGSQRW
jgi:predicted nucleic acid-binding protein